MKFKLLAPLVAVAPLVCAGDYDSLICDTRVIDGSGNPWYPADEGNLTEERPGKVLRHQTIT